MVINQGDIFWVDIEEPVAGEPGFSRSFAVIQNNAFNHSALKTVIACTLTTNLKRANSSGNVLLDSGEVNLPKQSVVNVSQILTLDKNELRDHIGTLSEKRVRQILDGIKLITEPRELDEENDKH